MTGVRVLNIKLIGTIITMTINVSGFGTVVVRATPTDLKPRRNVKLLVPLA